MLFHSNGTYAKKNIFKKVNKSRNNELFDKIILCVPNT